MKAEDLLSEGERAKRHLRIAQALAQLAKSRRPSLVEVQAATTRLEAKQPAVAMAIILAHAKRQPLHERGDWLKAAAEALHAYRLGDGADQKEAELAHEHIERETSLHKAELARLEKLRGRFSLALLSVLVTAMVAALIYVGYSFAPRDTAKPNEADKTTTTKKNDEMTVAPKANQAKTTAPHTEGKPATEKPTPAEAKKTDKDSKKANSVGK
jgi:hypothetical protein